MPNCRAVAIQLGCRTPPPNCNWRFTSASRTYGSGSLTSQQPRHFTNQPGDSRRRPIPARLQPGPINFSAEEDRWLMAIVGAVSPALLSKSSSAPKAQIRSPRFCPLPQKNSSHANARSGQHLVPFEKRLRLTASSSGMRSRPCCPRTSAKCRVPWFHCCQTNPPL